MRTTLDIEDGLLARAKRFAAAEGTTLRDVVEDALRARLSARPEAQRRYPFDPPVIQGKRTPAADVADRNSLYDLLDEKP